MKAVWIVLLTCFFISCKKEDLNITYPSQQPVTSRSYSAEEIKAFRQLTVDGQFNNGTIKKLMGTNVAVFLADSGYEHMNREFESIRREINTLTAGNLVLERSYNKSAALIRLYLTDKATYLSEEPAATNSFQTSSYELHGLAYLTWGNDNLISHAGVFIDMHRNESDTMIDKYLLRHEITHALGFMGHINMTQYSGSVMYQYMLSAPPNWYDPFDRKAIQLLYNPAVKAGMDGAALNAVLATL
ncbi:MAG: DUF2927 domain-containing protein [Ferruginibacter sp.]